MDLTKSLSLVSDTDPVMHEMLPKYHGSPESLRPLAFEMFKMMQQNSGVGLSANQLGRKERFFVMYGMSSKGFRDAIVAINPEIISRSDEKTKAIEGCLSFPKNYALVERSESINVEFTDLKGVRMTAILTKFFARVFQHELDHLNGLTMMDAGQDLTKQLLDELEKERTENK